MRPSLSRAWLAALLALLLTPAAMAAVVHHVLEARLDPAAHRLAVKDRISLPDSAPDTVVLRLHAGLEPRPLGRGSRPVG